MEWAEPTLPGTMSSIEERPKLELRQCKESTAFWNCEELTVWKKLRGEKVEAKISMIRRRSQWRRPDLRPSDKLQSKGGQSLASH